MSAKVRKGILTAVSAAHYKHSQFRRRNKYARVSAWGTVRGPRGGEYSVWLGKTCGTPGMVPKKQEMKVVKHLQQYLGKEVEFTCKRYRSGTVCFAEVDLLRGV